MRCTTSHIPTAEATRISLWKRLEGHLETVLMLRLHPLRQTHRKHLSPESYPIYHKPASRHHWFLTHGVHVENLFCWKFSSLRDCTQCKTPSLSSLTNEMMTLCPFNTVPPPCSRMPSHDGPLRSYFNHQVSLPSSLITHCGFVESTFYYMASPPLRFASPQRLFLVHFVEYSIPAERCYCLPWRTRRRCKPHYNARYICV